MSHYEIESNLLTRVSKQDVDDTINQLQVAYEQGRLDDKELGERMSLALSAKTHGDLLAITKDIAPSGKLAKEQPSSSLSSRTMALLGGIEKRGTFLVPKHHRIYAIMGGCVLDLREAQLESRETHLYVAAIMGGIEIFIKEGIRVELHGLPILGGFSEKSSRNLPLDAPVIHVHGVAICGGVDIRTENKAI